MTLLTVEYADNISIYLLPSGSLTHTPSASEMTIDKW